MNEGLIIEKTWGEEVILTNRPKYCAKILIVETNKICSFHRHKRKEETFIVLSGVGWIETAWDPTIRSDPMRLERGCVIHLEPGQWHRFWTEDRLTMLEISTHHDDEDVDRYQASGDIITVERPEGLANAIGFLLDQLDPNY